ncbi:MAG: hypothetical protein ACE5G0_06630 [Rhodothermales bacterium]
MSTFTAVRIGRWITLLVLLLSMVVVAPDASAQSRQRKRDRTGRAKTSRVEQKNKSTAARTSRQSRKKNKPTARAGRQSRSSKASRRTSRTRSREAKVSRGKTKTRTDRAKTSRTTSRKPSRQAKTSRGNRTKTRTRTVETSRKNTRTRAKGAKTERKASGTRSGKQKGRVDRGKDRVERGKGRSDRQKGRVDRDNHERSRGRDVVRGGRTDKAQRSRNRKVEDNRGRDSRKESRNKARQGRRQDTRQGRGGAVSRTPRRRDVSSDRRVDRSSRGRKGGNRRSVRYVRRDNWQAQYESNHRYRRKHWKRRYHRKKKLYFKPFIVRPRIHIDLYWPWMHRHRHGWKPRYQYRQVIYVDAGWGRSYHQAQIDVRTYYYHELRSATANRADVDIYIEKIELYENGRFIGEVHNIPKRLSRIQATVYRDGQVSFDRDVFIVGDTYRGFELISTRYYDDFVLNAYNRSHGMRVGVVDLQRGRVVSSSHSYLFDPYDFQGYVPVSLLPEDRSWLLDYGNGSFSGAYYEYDPYYYGGYSDYGNEYDDPYYGDDYYEEDYYEDEYGRPNYSVRSTVAEANFNVAPLSKVYDRNYSTEFGAKIHLRRETEFVRVK